MNTISAEQIYDYIVGGENRDHRCGRTFRAVSRALGCDELDRNAHDLITSMIVSGYLRQNSLGALETGPVPFPLSSDGRRRMQYRSQLARGQDPVTPCAPAGAWPNGPVRVTVADLDTSGIWFPLFTDRWSYHIKAYNDHRRPRCAASGWLSQIPGVTAAYVHDEVGGDCCTDCATVVRRAPAPGPAGVPPPGRRVGSTPAGVPPGARDGDRAPQPVEDQSGPRRWGPAGVPPGVATEIAADQRRLQRLQEADRDGVLTTHELGGPVCPLGYWHEGPCELSPEEAAARAADDAVLDAYGSSRVVDRGPETEKLRRQAEVIRMKRRPRPEANPHTGAMDFDDAVAGSDNLTEQAAHLRRTAERFDDQARRADTEQGRRVAADDALFWHAAADMVEREAEKPAGSTGPATLPEPDPDTQDGQATWRAGQAEEDAPVRRDRPPRMTYQRWFRSQDVQIGSRGPAEHYWRCPKRDCPVWGGPYTGAIRAKRDGLQHVYGPAHHDPMGAQS